MHPGRLIALGEKLRSMYCVMPEKYWITILTQEGTFATSSLLCHSYKYIPFKMFYNAFINKLEMYIYSDSSDNNPETGKILF
jgi:hypothetical protein